MTRKKRRGKGPGDRNRGVLCRLAFASERREESKKSDPWWRLPAVRESHPHTKTVKAGETQHNNIMIREQRTSYQKTKRSNAHSILSRRPTWAFLFGSLLALKLLAAGGLSSKNPIAFQSKLNACNILCFYFTLQISN